ncbi:50S ribosomal protein L16 [Candidatus Woesearchaeota archaeon]|nr:50S ribosomal protein L16 [Candidatus Woesearchaeota archaeon]
MAKLRKGVSYRRIERPYTRRSKFQGKAFVKCGIVSKVVRYEMGESRPFPITLNLVAGDSIQIRHNSLEAARQTSNRLLEKVLGKVGYHMRVRVYPHHILRENPLAAGAGADRMSTGMAHAFGKPIGIAAQVKKGQVIMQVNTEPQHLELAKQALRRAKCKVACQCKIVMVRNKPAQ